MFAKIKQYIDNNVLLQVFILVALTLLIPILTYIITKDL